MKWFGDKAWAPVCEPGERVEVPRDTRCGWCQETIGQDESGFVTRESADAAVFEHRACFLRQVIGSVAHLQRRCACYMVGSRATDPPVLSRRQAAIEAVWVWSQKNV